MTVLWGSRSGLTTGTDLPPSAAPGMDPYHYGADIAAIRGASAARSEILVASWGGAVRFTGPFTRTGGHGPAAVAQDSVPDASETEDRFGTTVAVGDVTRDGRPELFVGAAGENDYTGAVWTFPGFTAGPVAARSQVFTAASVGLTQQSLTLLGGYGLGWVI
ncbi:hypothetical protein QFZ56_004041 [Streptomyces achromogenes]|uniref:VCBS repeat-containing protein n=1 Tax=Streptomyces achromogenes TaxID=67255 RepID=A0ABU0Q5K0_STRAH|nr:FG-GAP repeat protein [Streptomyces achromogenes]MDQ0685078.1 hypothetical protein [Streptomyces achromogenes]